LDRIKKPPGGGFLNTSNPEVFNFCIKKQRSLLQHRLLVLRGQLTEYVINAMLYPRRKKMGLGPLGALVAWSLVFADWGQTKPGMYRGRLLRWEDFGGRDLQGYDFTGAKLHEVRFNGARLQGAIFKGCTFSETKFMGADLTNADFTDADWGRSDQYYMVYIRSLFRGATLTGARFPENWDPRI
jgi:hypothetical protein